MAQTPEDEIARLRALVAAAPTDLRLRLRLADTLRRCARPADAATEYRAVAVLYIEAGKPLLAVTMYLNALRTVADDAVSALSLAQLYETLGLPLDAAEKYTHSAAILDGLGRSDEAHAARLNALRLDPNGPRGTH